MGLLRKAAAVIRRALSLTDPTGWEEAGRTSHAGEMVTDGSVLAISTAWACVNLLAGTIASLPLAVYRTNAETGARQVDRTHALYRVLHASPNADQTALEFWEYMQAALELRGNAYARVERSGSRVVALHPVNPAVMSVSRDSGGALRYRWSDDSGTHDLGQDAVLHIRGFGGSPLGGLSTLAYGRHTFGLAIATDRAAGATFANGMRPSVAITFKSWLTQEQRELVEDKLTRKFIGAVNAGRPFINEGDSTLQPLTMNPEDAQMLESRGFSVEEICRWFGVPPHMVGHTQKSTSWGTGLEQQVLAFQKFALRRRLKRIEQAVMKQLLSAQDRAAGVVVEFNLEGLLRGDSAARAAFYQRMTAMGAMTINEVRALENLPPVDGGDVPRIQKQNVPITESPGLGHNGGPPLEEDT